MGWWDGHLHQFLCKGKRYGVPDPEWDFDRFIDDTTITLKDLKWVALSRQFSGHF